MQTLQGQSAVITGASSGVGEGLALALAEAGVNLHLHGRDRQRLEAVATACRARGVRAATYYADLGSEQELQRLVEDLRAGCDAVDLLLHSAGIVLNASIANTPVRDLDLQYRVNLRAPFVITQGLLSGLLASRGQVVFINSSVGLASRAEVGPYAATKYGLRALADALRGEVNAAGVRVLSVFLGRTATPVQERIHRAEGKAYRPELLIQPKDVAQSVLASLLLPRTAELTELSVRPMQKGS